MQPQNRRFASISASCAFAALLSACGPTPVSAQALPVPDPAAILWSCTFPDSFTSCGFSEQALVPGRATIVSIGRDGPTSVRLHTEPGDNNIFGSGTSERNDLELSDSASACSQGQEAWWAHSVLFPDDFVQVPESTGSDWNFGVVADFHQSGSVGPTMWELDAMPATALSPDRPTGLQFVGHGGDPANPTTYGAAIGPLLKNVWYDFVYHVRWSPNADGFFYAWVNGVQKLAYTGPTLYTGNTCYLKLANYHSPTGQPSSIIHDRVIRGSTPNAVSLELLDGVAMASATSSGTDTTPPTTPTGLVASSISSSQIGLSWNAATDDVGVTGYRVYRGGALLVTLGAVTSYQDSGLRASTAYSYTVQAADAAGNVSGQSAAASAATQAAPDITAPSTPGGLLATAVSASQINLSWAAASDDVGVVGYRVYRGGVLLVTLGAVTSYQDSGLRASTTYSYTVQATDAAGNPSGQSVAASATTPPASDTAAPSIPTGLKGTAVSASQINLSWNASTDNVGVAGYTVYLNGVALATTGGTSFRHTGLAPATTYAYRVSSFDAVGNKSAWTAAVSVKTPKRRVARGDFDGNGKSDIVWRNGATGDNAMWLMNGAAVASASTFSTVADFAWAIAGVGDFDGDGKADILWRNSAAGANLIWLMSGASVLGDVAISSQLDSNWSVAGLGDFDGDGRSDILWRNAATGALAIWLMSGATVAGGATGFAAMADPNWSVVGVADFDGDARADILWRNIATGDNLLWLMKGAAIASAVSINALPDPAWTIVGTDDFDGDGKADILWRNTTTGENAIWFMRGATVASSASIWTVADPNWSVAGTGDFDGDGKADILWRNAATGQDAVWFLSGATVSSGPFIATMSDPGWSVASP